MYDDALMGTFAAASETVLPGSTSHDVHHRVVALFDAALPGYPVLVHGLLDAFAHESHGSAFAELSEDQRSKVLKTMMADASVDVRDVVDGLFLFTLGQSYNEAHPDHERVWERIGYHGPSEGIPNWDRGDADA